MAIDTAEKRKSAAQVLSGLFGPSVTPNSSNDAEWRQQVGWGYSGIAAAVGITATLTATLAELTCSSTLAFLWNDTTDQSSIWTEQTVDSSIWTEETVASQTWTEK